MSNYGLSNDNPARVAPPRSNAQGGTQDPIMADVLAVAVGKGAKDAYLHGLRCPNGRGINWHRQGANIGAHMKPVDKYLVLCKCGQHRATIYIDAYSPGPGDSIALPGWTLADGPDEAPAAEVSRKWWQVWK